MLFLRLLPILLLPHHIGDLEIKDGATDLSPMLPHHIGDLEIALSFRYGAVQLPHHIGDLESFD